MRQIGKLRHRVELQSPTTTRSATGAALVSYATAATVWAAVEPLSGREYLAASQTQNEVSARIVIRYYSGLVPSWRVVFGSKTYIVESVINDDERGNQMQLMCKEAL
jgi:SPP1 family predicted phage head-tail adaptor